MKILITGATGLVGTRLLEKLILKGYEDLRILTRNKMEAKKSIPFPVEIFEWNPEKGLIEDESLKNVDVVIHLAGDNISTSRWNKNKKNQILNSRTKSSELLIETIKKLNQSPKKIISSSAIGIYGDTGDELVSTQNRSLGTDFLAEVCKAWEKSILTHSIEGMQVNCIRTGIVLSNQGGALPKMLPAFQMGLAGKLGSGKQYMSWIHIDDLVNQFIFLLENEGKNKIYNGVSPSPVTNTTFTQILGKTTSRPTIFPVPGAALKIILGEMSDLLLKGQKVLPQEFLEEGFVFKYPTLEKALSNLLEHSINGEVIFKKFLWINKSTPDVFNFFSNEHNLEKITPPHLNFNIVKTSTDKITEGTLIDYKLKIHGVPVKWKTLITAFEKNKTFTDNQLKGPYSKWVHQHDFIPYKNGTLMKDEVVYKIPLGFLGKIVAASFIKKDVSNIFKYRNETITNNLTGQL